MKIGFIGVGTIASAVATGFCTGSAAGGHEIYLSPRNPEKAKKLADAFDNVTVCASNQEVLDRADWVILALVPRVAEGILAELTFREDQVVVSFMSDFPVARVEKAVGKVKRIIRVLPLPFAARRIGPVVLFPSDAEARGLFGQVGQVVEVDDEDKMETLLAITGIMSAFYGLAWEVVSWGERAGLSRKEAADYTTSFFEALCIQGRNAKDCDISALANEYTPGGLNEMGLVAIRDEAKAYNPWVQALNAILDRLKKK